MIWSLETEDYRGVSGVTSPLLRSIRSTYVSITNVESLYVLKNNTTLCIENDFYNGLNIYFLFGTPL